MRKEIIRQSNRQFIPWGLSIIAVVAVALGSIITVMKHQFIQSTSDQNNNLFNIFESNIKENFKDIKTDIHFLKDLLKRNPIKELNTDKIKELEHIFLSLASSSKQYDQIRFLSKEGDELIRVNKSGDTYYPVKRQNLQDKKHRYYFESIKRLDDKDLYISGFDLNIENNQIELPIKPVIRFGTKIYNNNQEVIGYLLINYLGEKLLNEINTLSRNSKGELYFLNQDGYFLIHPDKTKEWGFMFPKHSTNTVDHIMPRINSKNLLERKDNYMHSTKDGFFYLKKVNFKKIIGIPPVRKDNNHIYFLINYIKDSEINHIIKERVVLWSLLIIPLVFIVLISNWTLINYRLIKRKNIKEIEEKHLKLKMANALLQEHKEELRANTENLLVAIKEKAKAEKQCSSYEEKLNGIFTNIPIGICLINKSQKISFVNPYICKLSEHKNTDLKGKPKNDFLLPLKKEENIFSAPTEMLIQGKKKKMPVLTHWFIPEVENDDFCEGCFIQNISTLKEAETSLRSALKKEKEAKEIKSNIVTLISHEFRTPMSIILSTSELLIKHYNKFSAQEVKNELTTISDKIIQMEKMIDNILYINSTEDNKNKIDIEEIDLVKFISGIIEDFKKKDTSNHIYDFQASTDSLIVPTSTSSLYNVLTMILTNAKDYSPPESKINIQVVDIENVVRIHIEDFGIGIPEEEKKHIFSMFHRGKNIKDTKGSGLELALAQRITKALHGKITFTSELNKGSRFIIDLPKSFKDVHAKSTII